MSRRGCISVKTLNKAGRSNFVPAVGKQGKDTNNNGTFNFVKDQIIQDISNALASFRTLAWKLSWHGRSEIFGYGMQISVIRCEEGGERWKNQ